MNLDAMCAARESRNHYQRRQAMQEDKDRRRPSEWPLPPMHGGMHAQLVTAQTSAGSTKELISEFLRTEIPFWLENQPLTRRVLLLANNDTGNVALIGLSELEWKDVGTEGGGTYGRWKYDVIYDLVLDTDEGHL
jgi:hypothetical protein